MAKSETYSFGYYFGQLSQTILESAESEYLRCLNRSILPARIEESMPCIVEYEKGIRPIVLQEFDHPTFQCAIRLMIGDDVRGDIITKKVGENMLEHIYFCDHSKIVCSPVGQEDLHIFVWTSMPILPNLPKTGL